MRQERSSARSFDYLVCAGEQRRRDGEAERLGGHEVEDQFEFGRRITGKSLILSPFKIRPT
jgi:hypothetical protein